MEWKNININANLIVAETGKATLINFPHKSDFDKGIVECAYMAVKAEEERIKDEMKAFKRDI